MPANKVKGLLKGLRYISQVFDNEKEPEMQIGHPTDVKHVSHIGCDGSSDGQSDNTPAWMREFSPPPSFSGRDGEISDNSSTKWDGEDSSSNQRSVLPLIPPSVDMPEKPRSSRRPSLPNKVTSTIGSSKKSKSDKSKQSRRSKSNQTKESSSGSESPARILSELPKKSRRKKTKEGGSSVRNSSKSKVECCESNFACPFSDPGPGNDELPPLRSPLKSYGGEQDGYF